MTDQSAVLETGPLAELPTISHGAKRFSGSAGLAIAWNLDSASIPPVLVCTLSALTPGSEHASGMPASILRLSLEASSQPFQVERRASPDEADADGGDVNPRQASGVIFLGRKTDQPGMLRPGGKTDANTPLYLHVHCRLGASSAFVGKIARGTHRQFEAWPVPAAKEEASPAATPGEPAAAAVARKKTAAAKGKPRNNGKPSR